MKFGKYRLTLLFVLTFFSNTFSQCLEGTYVIEYTPQIANEPDFWFNNNAIISYLHSGQLLMEQVQKLWTKQII